MQLASRTTGAAATSRSVNEYTAAATQNSIMQTKNTRRRSRSRSRRAPRIRRARRATSARRPSTGRHGALRGPRRHARRSPRGRNDVRGGDADCAASARRRASDHSRTCGQYPQGSSKTPRPRGAADEWLRRYLLEGRLGRRQGKPPIHDLGVARQASKRRDIRRQVQALVAARRQ